MWLWSACDKVLNDVRQCHDAVHMSIIIDHPQSTYLQCIKRYVHTKVLSNNRFVALTSRGGGRPPQVTPSRGWHPTEINFLRLNLEKKHWINGVIIIIIINEFHRDASLTKTSGLLTGGSGEKTTGKKGNRSSLCKRRWLKKSSDWHHQLPPRVTSTLATRLGLAWRQSSVALILYCTHAIQLTFIKTVI